MNTKLKKLYNFQKNKQNSLFAFFHLKKSYLFSINLTTKIQISYSQHLKIQISNSFLTNSNHYLQIQINSISSPNNLNPKQIQIQNKNTISPTNIILSLSSIGQAISYLRTIQNSMLQSSPAFIKCFQCKRGPKEFSFLLCNHIICGKCIKKNIQLSDKYNWVTCPCGTVTYFNQDNQILDSMVMNSMKSKGQCLNKSKDHHNSYHQHQTIQQKRQINNNKMRNNFIPQSHNDNIFAETLGNNQRSTITSNISISQIFSLQSQNNSDEQYQDKHNKYEQQKYKYLIDNNKNVMSSPSLMKKIQDSNINKYYFGTQNNTTVANGDESLLLENYGIINGKKHQKINFVSSNIKSYNQNKIFYNNNNSNSRHINQFSTHYVIDDKNNDDEQQCQPKQQQKLLNKQQQSNQLLSPKSKIVMIPNVKNLASSVTLPETMMSLKQHKSPIQTPKQQSSSSTMKKVIAASLSKEQLNKFSKQQQNRQKQYSQKYSQKQKSHYHKNHSRFQNEIGFMGIMFKKDLQQVQYIFDNVLREIKSVYFKLQKTLKSLYIQQVISNGNQQQKDDMIWKMNLSELIKQRYQKDIGQRFNHIKNNLSSLVYSFRHNQKNLNLTPKSYSSHIMNIHQILKDKNIKYSKKNHYETAQTLNNSQLIFNDQEHNNNNSNNYDDQQQQSLTMKNKKIQRFQTVQEKLQRLTTKNNSSQLKNKQSKNHLNSFNSSSNKRVQTQNIHTNLKSRVNLNFYQKENQDRGNCSIQQFTPQINYRLTQKPQRRSNPISLDKQTQNKRRQIVYFSPPLPYCNKHLQKKQKQAKNYISYIEKLCHDKKMKNHQQLFKKVKQNNQSYEFRNRE